MVLGLNPVWAIGAACIFIAIYPIREYALVRLRNSERREELKVTLEGGSNQILHRHATPAEINAIDQFAEKQPE